MADTILEEIAAKTRERVAAAKRRVPPAEMERRARALGAQTGFPFEAALRGKDIAFICEVKKASPSKGVIALEFPYRQIALDYEAAGAAAVSVLTEPAYFQGADAYLSDIAAAVGIPVLRKDFTVDEYQIYEAKILGASAVLLICAILSEKELGQFLKMAHSLGLSALVEAHDEEEVARALRAGAQIIGVNNRNLKDFTVDFANAARLRDLIPAEVVYVAESGVTGPEDVASLRAIGADAVLIGEALMRSPDKESMLAAMKEAVK